jgi:hypothetical protein
MWVIAPIVYLYDIKDFHGLISWREKMNLYPEETRLPPASLL